MKSFKVLFVSFLLVWCQLVQARPSRRFENEIVKKTERRQRLLRASGETLEADYYENNADLSFHGSRPGEASDTESCDYIRGVPDELVTLMRPFGIGQFYQKYTEAYGIPVIGSEHVDDDSLRRACYVLRFLLADRQSLRHAFYSAYSRVAVIATNEKIRDLPEYGDFLPKYYDKSVRALAGTPGLPVTAIGEENLLCTEEDSHRYEDILVRELAISILLTAVPRSMPRLREELDRQYVFAMESSYWQNTYASISPELYLGETVQSFFNVNAYAHPADGEHNEIRTRVLLQYYDSGIFNLIIKLFPCGNNLISRCQRRGSEGFQVLEMDCPSHYHPRHDRGR